MISRWACALVMLLMIGGCERIDAELREKEVAARDAMIRELTEDIEILTVTEREAAESQQRSLELQRRAHSLRERAEALRARISHPSGSRKERSR